MLNGGGNMTTSKYGTVLTIVLIVLVVAILGGVGAIIYNYAIKPNNDNNEMQQAIAEFNMTIDNNQNNDDDDENYIDDNTTTTTPVERQENTDNKKKKTYYKGYVMAGYITIPATNVSLPILDHETPETLNTAAVIRYPSNAILNEPGNVVIAGHNYKNNQFFSNNKKLTVGDKIRIKDDTGRELSYTIYEKFETTVEDTSFYNRNTNGAVEITLTTCTDDAKARIIILARAD